MKIWLDDERPAPAGFIAVKTVPQLINLLKENDEVACVSLDNDLGCNILEGYHTITQYLMALRSDCSIAKVDCWDIHTANPVAANKMTSLLHAGIRRGILAEDTCITQHFAGQGM